MNKTKPQIEEHAFCFWMTESLTHSPLGVLFRLVLDTSNVMLQIDNNIVLKPESLVKVLGSNTRWLVKF